jgi:conserved hypothetical protein TIGR00096
MASVRCHHLPVTREIASEESLPAGSLHVIATPIGNLGDLSARAARMLASVDRLCAEDTRTSGVLLRSLGIGRALQALHEHNEAAQVPGLIEFLRGGGTVGLISDAGTPLLSDPGYLLVTAARDAGLPVYAVPGPSAALAALSISGLPTDRFVFEGFPPPRPAARRDWLAECLRGPATWLLFESSHRIDGTLTELAELAPTRRVCLCRELTKRFEQSLRLPAAELPAWLAADPQHRRGEFVLVVEGAQPQAAAVVEQDRLLGLLLAELAPSAAARVAAGLSGAPRRALYARALELAGQDRKNPDNGAPHDVD